VSDELMGGDDGDVVGKNYSCFF